MFKISRVEFYMINFLQKGSRFYTMACYLVYIIVEVWAASTQVSP